MSSFSGTFLVTQLGIGLGPALTVSADISGLVSRQRGHDRFEDRRRNIDLHL